jgi:hypothetical protein
VVDSMTRAQVLGFRVRAQELDRAPGTAGVEDVAVLDIGVQDTGPDGGLWALAVRGVDVAALAGDELATVWSIRGAPHLYRRADLPAVAAAVAPFSDADAGKRIYDASRPLKAAGIGNLAALDVVAAAMRRVVRTPTVKGEVSTQVTRLLDKPYLRFCRGCDATHPYEMTFRLAALRAGLELEAGTSPPVLRRIRGGLKPAATVPERLDVIRGYLRLLGPATHKHVADYLDAPVTDVRAHWPADAVPVSVAGEKRWLLAGDAGAAASPVRVTRLLGPYDLFLQARDRPLLVAEPARARTLWPALGRPGAVLVDGEIAGTWRPRSSGGKLRLAVEVWAAASAATRRAVQEQAERLAAFRGVPLTAVEFDA